MLNRWNFLKTGFYEGINPGRQLRTDCAEDGLLVRNELDREPHQPFQILIWKITCDALLSRHAVSPLNHPHTSFGGDCHWRVEGDI